MRRLRKQVSVNGCMLRSAAQLCTGQYQGVDLREKTQITSMHAYICTLVIGGERGSCTTISDAASGVAQTFVALVATAIRDASSAPSSSPSCRAASYLVSRVHRVHMKKTNARQSCVHCGSVANRSSHIHKKLPF